MINHQSNWRGLAEKVTKEQDPEKLMAIVEELTGVLAQREAVAQEPYIHHQSGSDTSGSSKRP